MGPLSRAARLSCSNGLIGCVLALSVAITAGNAKLSFDIRSDSSLSAQALAGLELAAARWSNVLLDPVTISLQVQTHPSPSSFIAVTELSLLSFAYGDYRSALGADRQSGTDHQAYAAMSST